MDVQICSVMTGLRVNARSFENTQTCIEGEISHVDKATRKWATAFLFSASALGEVTLTSLLSQFI